MPVHACMCVLGRGSTQDTLSPGVNFESSAGDCPTQTILRKELCFRSFLGKRPPGDADGPAQWDRTSAEPGSIPCKAVPGERELSRARTGQEAIPKAPERQWEVSPCVCAIKDCPCSVLLHLLIEQPSQPLSLSGWLLNEPERQVML